MSDALSNPKILDMLAGDNADDQQETAENQSAEEQPVTEQPSATEEQPTEESEKEQPAPPSLLEELGFESIDDVRAVINEHKSIKPEYEQANSRLKAYDEDDQIKAIMAFRESGGDAYEYLKLQKTDYDQMNGDQVLWEKWALDNKEDVQFDPELAKAAFAREMRDKYTLKKPQFADDDERAEWERENAEELSFREKKRKLDENKARQALKSRKDKIVAELPTPTGKSNEDAEQALKDYQTSVAQAINQFKPIEIGISDKQEESFKLALNDELKQAAEVVKNSPADLFGLIGMGEDGSINAQQAIEAVAILKAFKNGSLGKKLAEHVLNVRNAETIETQQVNPSTTKDNVSQVNESDLLSQLRSSGIVNW